ncbi:CBN-HIM-4 protein, partial [Aphelenchoides avenae]
PPTVTKEGEKVLNTTQGEPSVITCDVQGQEPEIAWLKDDVPFMPDEEHELSENDLQLTIRNTSLTDEGAYTCTAMNQAGNATQKTQLFVGVPPKIAKELDKVVKKAGETAELWCEAVGIPPPQVTWLRDGDPFTFTAKDVRTEKAKSTAVFQDIRPDQAGLYYCKATNWAGTAIMNVSLVVLTPPMIYPDKENFTANINSTAILTCNATGIPEPVITWVRTNPEVDFAAHPEKYNMIGSMLAINNVTKEDEGFYHCIANGMEAGQTIGVRQLSVEPALKHDKVRPLWVECDDKGRPITKEYRESRGDTPESEEHLMEYGDSYLDYDTNTTDFKYTCLPPLDDPAGRRHRTVPVNTVPQFVDVPADTRVAMGEEAVLFCRANGSPPPGVFWFKGDHLQPAETVPGGGSRLRITVDSEDKLGRYTCLAKSMTGENRHFVNVELASPETTTTPKPDAVEKEKALTVVNCVKDGVVEEYRVDWTIDGKNPNELDRTSHVMNNGSLVLSYFAEEDDLAEIKCAVRGQPGDSFDVAYVQVEDKVPRVVIPPLRIVSHPGSTIDIDCHIKRSHPLTTRITWTRNNVLLEPDFDKVIVHPNNSLQINNVMHSDRAEYRCRAESTKGKAYDKVELVIDDAPNTIVTHVGGTVNGEPVMSQALTMNMTPEVASNDVLMNVQNLAGNKGSVTRSFMGVMAMPLTHFG